MSLTTEQRTAALTMTARSTSAEEARLILGRLGLVEYAEPVALDEAGGHGTLGGYETHIRRRREPCSACRVAHRAYNLEYRKRRAAA